MKQTLLFRLESPLTVGGKKWGMVQSTRPYVPGWTIWGCLTRSIVEHFFQKPKDENYNVGKLLDQNLWISHARLMVLMDACPIFYLPSFDDDTGRIEFRWRSPGVSDFLPISGYTSTALTPDKGAWEESLHEREAIPHRLKIQGKIRPVYLTTTIYYFREKEAVVSDLKIVPQSNSLSISGNEKTIALTEILKSQPLTLGRSGGVGQGKVSLVDQSPAFSAPDHLDTSLAHFVLPDDSQVCYKGEWEPLVHRRWHNERGPGKDIIYKTMALTPGSLVMSNQEWTPAKLNGSFLHGCFEPICCA